MTTSCLDLGPGEAPDRPDTNSDRLADEISPFLDRELTKVPDGRTVDTQRIGRRSGRRDFSA